MNKNNKKDDFFNQMQNYKLDQFNRLNLFIMILIIFFGLLFSILCVIFTTNVDAINKGTLGLLWASIAGIVISYIFELVCFMQVKSMEFKAGKLSSGLVNFAISIVVVYTAIFILGAILPQERQSLIPAIIAAATALFTATLALMGIHYSNAKKREERMIKNKLVFIKDVNTEETIEYALRRASDCMTIDICLKNISHNFGFLCGLYRICGCDIYAIEDRLPYFPIAPEKSYFLKNINYKNGDDQLLLIYKDIEDNHYYIHLRILSNQTFDIINIDICDMNFIQQRLKTTARMAKKLTINDNRTIDEKIDSATDDIVNINKESTKPLRTKEIDGYEIIVNENGDELTDRALLEKLKKARLIISRANRVRAYMIFNNQQLVALATYKPINHRAFISIYGLGEGKYNLYGKDFIDIIKIHIGQ